MTEYDYNPEVLDRYHPAQDRLSDWAGLGQRFGSQASYGTKDPYDEYSNYDHRTQRNHRGRSQTRRDRYNNPSYSGQSTSDELFRDSSRHTLQGGFTNSTRSGQIHPSQPFYNASQNPTVTSMQGGMPGSVSRAHSFRQGMSQGIPGEHSISSLSILNAPVPDQFSYSQSQNNSFRNTRPIDIPYTSSRRSYRSYSRPIHGYTSSYNQTPIIVPQSYRSRSSRTHTGDSYSTDSGSYSSSTSSRYRSRSRSHSPSYHRHRYGENYRTVHTSRNSPTVIHPSRDHPTVVPINGGVGGYVVVPAVGQRLRLANTNEYRLSTEPSFFERLLSPSKWRKKY